MTISLLHIVVPTVLALAVLIIYMNSCNKRILKEIGKLKAQLEKLDNVSVPEPPETKTVANAPVQPEIEPLTADEDKRDEEKDAPDSEKTDSDASAYNTGKSGKFYTKEELELLIKE